jgi:hypothetical protein
MTCLEHTLPLETESLREAKWSLAEIRLRIMPFSYGGDLGREISGHGGPGYGRLWRGPNCLVGRASLPVIFVGWASLPVVFVGWASLPVVSPAEAGVHEKSAGSRPPPGRRNPIRHRIYAMEH